MRLFVKIGGAQLEEPGPRRDFCKSVASARRTGHDVVVVHGGGNQIRAVCKAIGIEDRYHEGLRITDAKTAEIVLMVLGGLVNRTLVGALQNAGVDAVGLCGADGASFSARKLVKAGVDLGFVGEIDGVNPVLLASLLDSAHVPVVATVAPGRGADDAAPFFNLNADHAASPLCKALRGDALLFLTDVPGVLDAEGKLIETLTPKAGDALVRTGVAKGGMIPKLEAARMALRENPDALVKVAPAGGPDAILRGLQEGVGTVFQD
ncbi:MAG: acetylglutamate kinase [Planctomycetes bacterium]|nr:acetylglutamate kinase [Planctomycetota bacterium]